MILRDAGPQGGGEREEGRWGRATACLLSPVCEFPSTLVSCTVTP